MSMPNIPDIDPKIDLKIEDTINLLLASIALEEISLSHIINAEAEKLQEMIKKAKTLEDLFDANDSIERTLRSTIKKEILLEFKFENVLELLKKQMKHGC